MKLLNLTINSTSKNETNK